MTCIIFKILKTYLHVAGLAEVGGGSGRGLERASIIAIKSDIMSGFKSNSWIYMT